MAMDGSNIPSLHSPSASPPPPPRTTPRHRPRRPASTPPPSSSAVETSTFPDTRNVIQLRAMGGVPGGVRGLSVNPRVCISCVGRECPATGKCSGNVIAGPGCSSRWAAGVNNTPAILPRPAGKVLWGRVSLNRVRRLPWLSFAGISLNFSVLIRPHVQTPLRKW